MLLRDSKESNIAVNIASIMKVIDAILLMLLYKKQSRLYEL